MRARETRHGHNTQAGSSPTHRSWAHMIQRCRNPNNTNYAHYGGRGISVCDRWLSFESFLADMGERPDGTTLDRIDVNGNYALENCRWAPNRVQKANQRRAIWLDYKGERICLEHLAKRLGMKSQVLDGRIKRGWPPELWDLPRKRGRNQWNTPTSNSARG